MAGSILCNIVTDFFRFVAKRLRVTRPNDRETAGGREREEQSTPREVTGNRRGGGRGVFAEGISNERYLYVAYVGEHDNTT